MLATNQLGSALGRHGIDLFTGVPCSSLKSLINFAINERRYVLSTNEGDAVAVCAGLSLGGRRAALLLQNSGLTNASSPLTSLTHTFRIPLLAFVSLRGDPPEPEEPQHQLMGRITTSMLELMGVEWHELAKAQDAARAQIDAAAARLGEHRSVAFIVRPGTFDDEPLRTTPDVRAAPAGITRGRSGSDELPSRIDALRAIAESAEEGTALLATTGRTARELHELGDVPRNFYLVGSMGCLSSLALGVALAKPARKVIALDGDGSVLMRMGALPTLAACQPNNLLHVVLDNGTYDTTGGQPTVAPIVDFVRVASASGYPNAVYAHGLDEARAAVRDWSRTGGLTLLHLRIAPGSKKGVGRPTLTPEELKGRFMDFLAT